MIKYKGIEFETVDQLIEYQEKAEGLTRAVKINFNPGIVSEPPPFYPRQHNPWIINTPYNPNIWSPPLSPTCEPNSIINTWVSTDGAKAFREAVNE